MSRVGMRNTNSLGSEMIIEEYKNASDILVRFPDTNYSLVCSYSRFKTGNIKNPLDRSVYGVGYIGIGKHIVSKKGYHTHKYGVWKSMLQRCYSELSAKKYPSYYKICSVSDEWHNYQNFGDWYDDNYYEIENHRMNIDKDILIKGNKTYSPDTCIFVPEFINILFTRRKAERGNCPIGVRINNSSKSPSYESRSTDGKGGYVHLGCYKTPEEAFRKYKIHREQLIQQVAEEYKDRIPEKLHTALVNYKVDIND